VHLGRFWTYFNGGVTVCSSISILFKIYYFLSSQFDPLHYRLRAQGSRLKAGSLAFRTNALPTIQSEAKNTDTSIRVPCAVRRVPYTLLLVSLIILLFAIPFSAAQAASVDLEWNPNTEPELAGYKVYWGTSSGNYTYSKDVGITTAWTATGLDEGKTYYFAATAYDGSNNESGYSNQISYTVPYSDSDGDGVPDYQDAFPSNPAETVDTDGDGIGNNADADDDNDKMPDAWENQYGFDPLKDDAFDDADDDGLSNLDEYLAGSDPVVPRDNLEPDAPGLTAPADQQMVELTPELRTGGFFDPDSGDFHSATHWRIHRQSDNVCVFDITSEFSLTRINVPKLILRDETDYTWQARHYDNHGAPSQWSSSRSFTTRADSDDTNNNGIPDEQEVTAPSDLDGDGNWDSDQNTIKCVKTGENQSLGISFKGSGTVVGIESISAETDNGTNTYASAVSSPNYFPFGLINFKLIMDQPGDEAEITIYFSEPAPQDGRWFKYDPIETTWTDYSTQTDFSTDRYSVTLYLEDGGEGDADGIANGIIVDPSGVGISASSVGSGVSEGIVDAAACFISTASSPGGAIQVSPVWKVIHGRELAFMLVLLALLKGLTIVLRRSRQRWEEFQRRYEMYHQHGKPFTAPGLCSPKKVKSVLGQSPPRSKVQRSKA
jgi:chitinase